MLKRLTIILILVFGILIPSCNNSPGLVGLLSLEVIPSNIILDIRNALELFRNENVSSFTDDNFGFRVAASATQRIGFNRSLALFGYNCLADDPGSVLNTDFDYINITANQDIISGDDLFQEGEELNSLFLYGFEYQTAQNHNQFVENDRDWNVSFNDFLIKLNVPLDTVEDVSFTLNFIFSNGQQFEILTEEVSIYPE